MILTKKNGKEWMEKLDIKMEKQYNIKNFSNCNCLSVWERMYIGEDVQEAIDDEMYYSSQN